jgi:molecular chaperone HtpG
MNTRVKLYIKRVFITEEGVQLLPRYLRFVQGVVDSQDLPLNISRESLQYNSVAEKIKKALVKKIFSELEKKDQSEPEEYLKFWNNFGAVIKEGLCEHNVNNDELLDICKFYTSKSIDEPLGIKTYVERMAPEQKIIYYITGNSISNVDNSPQMEGFKAKGIEVLYLCDTVDDFWVTATVKYKDYQFKSITKADIDIENLNHREETQQEEDIKFDNEKVDGGEEGNIKNVSDSNYDDLVKLFKVALEKNNLKDIKISKKLTKSPVCLVVDEMNMDMKLERFLLEQKQIMTPLPKILEINPNHSLLRIIQGNMANPEKSSEIQEIIKTLFDEACMLEGEPIANPADFADRLNRLMEFSIHGI